MRGTRLVTALLMTAAAPGRAAPDVWNDTLSPHFHVLHEDAFTPPGFVLNLEKLHNRLRLDLSMFSPWMVKERAQIYLYKGQKSFLGGEFKPPQWSNGIAYYDRKLVAVYDQPSRKKLIEVISHEMTHLLFESYWGEARKIPPQWLNEGLAMMEENDNPRTSEASEWHEAMTYLRPDRLITIEKLVGISPTSDLTDKETVSLWYVQSYSLVYFLYRVYPHSRMQFFNLCRRMRDGKPFEAALWEVYRYQSLAKFEEAWKIWLKIPVSGRGGPRLSASAPVPGKEELQNAGKPRLKPIGFGDFDDRKKR